METTTGAMARTILVSAAVGSRASLARWRAAPRAPFYTVGALALGLLSPTWGFAELVK